MADTYSAVVESGSCSRDYTRWEERLNCGHKHKTIKAAEACLAKKRQWYCMHGRRQGLPCKGCLGLAKGDHTSADWYNGTIHNQNEERVDR